VRKRMKEGDENRKGRRRKIGNGRKERRNEE